ncbi:MAG: hypothetical protein WAU47_13325, partial [Desulfobaccales bacterium]
RLGHGLYNPNRQGEMFIPFGDLAALDPKTRGAIAEPRLVRYHTDTSGFRNDSDPKTARVLLVGDSFIAGSGSTQEDLLSVQLWRDYGIAAYNLAFPGELHSYVRYVQGFFQKSQSGAKALLFLFEGNDFPQAKPGGGGQKKPGAPAPPSSWEMARKEWQQWLKELLVYRYAFSFYHLFQSKLTPEAYGKVTLAKLPGPGDLQMGFLSEYVAVSRRAAYDGGEEFLPKLARIREHLGGIFFIPTKYRVYYNLLEGEQGPPLPNAQWAFLEDQARRLGVRCVNLTEPLQEESRRLLPQGKLTFWKDDSHWNRYGMAVAARQVQAFLQGQ